MNEEILTAAQALNDLLQKIQSQMADLQNRVTRLEQGTSSKPAIPDVNELEAPLRADVRVQRLLGNRNWQGAAEAAIKFLIHGERCPIDTWRTSSTWEQVKAAYDELCSK